MFYAHAQKQTNKHNPLSLSLTVSLPRHIWASCASLWTISFSSFYPERTSVATALSPFSLYLPLKTTQLFFTVILHFCRTLWHFLRRACVCLETHKLFGHLVVGPLREYPHNGEASFVHGDALNQGVAGGAAALVRQLSQLDDRHADDAILTGKAVVLYWDVQLVGLRTMFVT